MRLKRPGGVRAKLRRNSQRTQECPRFHIASDDHRIMDVPGAHGLNETVHVTRFSPIGERELILRRSEPQRTDHHRGQRVGKFALEHRAFASDDTVILPDLAKEKRRGYIRPGNLVRAPSATSRAASSSATQ